MFRRKHLFPTTIYIAVVGAVLLCPPISVAAGRQAGRAISGQNGRAISGQTGRAAAAVPEVFESPVCYYIDNSGGDDSNSGLTPRSPWKTLANVDGVLGPGIVIRFKRGEVWRLTGMAGTEDNCWEIDGKNGTAAHRIVITDYGTAPEPPLLTTLELWESGWEEYIHPTVKHAWKRTGVENRVNRCFFDGVGQGRADTIFDLNSVDTWCYDDTAGNLYVFSMDDPNGSKIETLPGNTDIYGQPTGGWVVILQDANYITLRNLALYGGFHSALRINGSGTGFTIRNCVIKYPVKAGIVLRDYTGVGITDVLIENNHVDYMLDPDEIVYIPSSGYTFPNTGLSDGIEIDRAASNVIVRGNFVKNFSHSSIQVNGKYSSAFGVSNIIVESNEMTAPDALHGYPWTCVGAEGKNTNNVFRWNYGHDMPTASHCNGSRNKFYGNIIENMRDDYKYPSRGLNMSTWVSKNSGEDMVCHHNEVFNNTIINTQAPGIILNDSWSAALDIHDNIIANNIIIDCDYELGEYYQIAVEDDQGNTTSPRDNLFLNNCLYRSGVTKLIWYKDAAYTVSEANNNAAFDDVFQDNIAADPLCVNYAGGDYHITIGSPCLYAGFYMGEQYLDFDGVLFNNPPSIGAFEYRP